MVRVEVEQKQEEKSHVAAGALYLCTTTVGRKGS